MGAKTSYCIKVGWKNSTYRGEIAAVAAHPFSGIYGIAPFIPDKGQPCGYMISFIMIPPSWGMKHVTINKGSIRWHCATRCFFKNCHGLELVVLFILVSHHWEILVGFMMPDFPGFSWLISNWKDIRRSKKKLNHQKMNKGNAKAGTLWILINVAVP